MRHVKVTTELYKIYDYPLYSDIYSGKVTK